MVNIYGYCFFWCGLIFMLWWDVFFLGMYWWGYEIICGKFIDVCECGRLIILEMDFDCDV